MGISVRVIAVTAVAGAMCACTATKRMTDVGYRPPPGHYRLIVMEPDIQVGLLTVGGAVEPRADWTSRAHDSVIKALAQQQSTHGADVTVVASAEDLRYDPQKLADLVWLHKAVGDSIRIHKYLGLTLPTKANRFDWTLGEPAVELGRATHYDYALFLHAEDSFESSGRVALRVADFLGCALGGVCISGGEQFAFASLVDLKTGQIVWFNTLKSSVGDIRTEEGAQKMVNTLLRSISSG
jgi:hypothetical protein